MAVALEANTPFNAIWIGVSTPVIISNLMKNPPEQVIKGAKLKKLGSIHYDLLGSSDASGPTKKHANKIERGPIKKDDVEVREPIKMEPANNKLAQGVKKVREYLGRL